MKKHRKLVALLIALTFLFSIAAPAMAATPSAEQKSADKLNVLGIIEGYPDGSFGLDKEITRAEFAKIAVVAAGMKDAADLLKSTPAKFSDVKTGEWYTGWINLAASQGFVKGDPQGTFRPNDNITYAEVVTVLLRLLGYNDNLPGDWPTNYLAKAVTLDITKGIAMDAKAPALRGSVFVMADKTLNTEMVEWSNDKQAFSEKEDSDGNKVKLIAKSFDGSMKNGLVVDLEWNSKGSLMVEVAGTGKKDMNSISRFEVLDSTIVTGAADMYALLGSNIEYVANDDDEIIYAAAKDTNIVSKDKAVVSGTSRVTIDGRNYSQADDFDWTVFPAGSSDLNAKNELVGDKVDVVLNSSGNAQWAFVYNFSDASADIIDEINGNKVYGVSKSRYDYDEKKVHVIIKDGVIADFDALAEGDLFYAVKEAKNTDYLVIASSEVLEGELEKANAGGDELTIDGKKIKTEANYLISVDSGDSFDGVLDDVVGEKVKYMLSPAGRIAAVISDVEGAQKLYGVVEYSGPTARGLETRILTPDGTKAVYYVDTDYVTEWEVATNKKPILVEYALDKNGKIDYVKTAEGINFNEYDGNRAELGGTWYRVDSNAAFFGKDAAGKNVASDWDNFKKITKGADDPLIYVLKPKGAVKAMFVNGVIAGKDNVGVIADTGRDRDGFFYEIFFEGEKVRYNLTTAAVDAKLDKLPKGTLVEFTLASGKINFIKEASASEVSLPTKVTEATTTYVEVGGKYYYIDEDTMIVDVIESTKKLVGRVGKGDYVLIHGDDKGVVEVIVIVSAPDQDALLISAKNAVVALETAANKDLGVKANLEAAEAALAKAEAALAKVDDAVDGKAAEVVKFNVAKATVVQARADFDKAAEKAAVKAVVMAVAGQDKNALAAALASDAFTAAKVIPANMDAYLVSVQFGALTLASTAANVDSALDAVNALEAAAKTEAEAVKAVVMAVAGQDKNALAAALASDAFTAAKVIPANMDAYLVSAQFGALELTSTAANVDSALDAVNAAVADQAAVDAAVLKVPATLNPVDGTDANVIDMVKAAINDATVSVTIKSTANSKVAANGDITYDTAETGNVVFTLTKGAASEDVTVSVVVVPEP